MKHGLQEKRERERERERERDRERTRPREKVQKEQEKKLVRPKNTLFSSRNRRIGETTKKRTAKVALNHSL